VISHFMNQVAIVPRKVNTSKLRNALSVVLGIRTSGPIVETQSQQTVLNYRSAWLYGLEGYVRAMGSSGETIRG